MSGIIQDFLAKATQRAASDLLQAAQQLSEDKRAWSPLDKGRTVLDQIAECALINHYAVAIVRTHQWPAQSMDEWGQAKAELSRNWDKTTAALLKSADDAAAAIQTVADDQLSIEIPGPWGTFTLLQILAYGYWNMSYHQGQITYIHTLSE